VNIDIAKIHRNSRAATVILKAMSNERRLLILCHLIGGEKSVGQLEDMIGISQSALSQHLARLRRDNIVGTRRKAQNIYYHLVSDKVPTMMATLQELFPD
jgi:DNA-binding transcriptional ArsR family regulator